MHSLSPHESLFKSWLEDYRGILYKVTRSFARTAAEAADLEQEMRLQLWISLGNFAGEAKPSTWIYRVCLNTAMTWRRTTKRREQRFDTVADFSDVHSQTATPAESTSETEMLEKLYAAINAMPDIDRALVLLSLDGMSYREISAITGLAEGNVGVALMRARKRLTNQLKGVANELE